MAKGKARTSGKFGWKRWRSQMVHCKLDHYHNDDDDDDDDDNDNGDENPDGGNIIIEPMMRVSVLVGPVPDY